MAAACQRVAEARDRFARIQWHGLYEVVTWDGASCRLGRSPRVLSAVRAAVFGPLHGGDAQTLGARTRRAWVVGGPFLVQRWGAFTTL